MSQSEIIRAALSAYVERGELAGAAAMTWRDGETSAVCVGSRDIAARLPVETDTLYRIASLTKPVTSVAALTLLQEGRFALDEPITGWAPEFAEMRVLTDPEGPLDATVPAERPITFGDLLTHRAGLTYGDFHSGPIAAAHKALGGDMDSDLTPDAWIATLAGLPLIRQPGAAFTYGHATDLLGQLIARIEGASLGETLRRRVFEPLGMADTSFRPSDAQRPRCALPFGFDEAGALAALPAPPGGAALAWRPAEMTYESGGQGLWSTPADYLSFARLFVEGGRGVLTPKTLALMTANHLTPQQRAEGTMFGMPLFAGHGFGLGVAVVMDPAKAPVTRCGGGVGSVGWPGAYGGWWQADAADGSAMIFLAHNMLQLDQLLMGLGLGVYGAITEFQALASAR